MFHIRYSGIKDFDVYYRAQKGRLWFKNTYFQCFKNPPFLQKLIDRKERLPETKCAISRSGLEYGGQQYCHIYCLLRSLVFLFLFMPSERQ